MDLASLKRELAAPRFAGLPDQSSADLFNGTNLTEQRPIPSRDVRKLLLLRGKWSGLRAASAERGSAADELFEALDTFDTFDLTEQAVAVTVTGAFTALIAAALLDQGDVDAILALGVHSVSRAEQLGWGPVGAGDVESARAVDDNGQFPGHADRLAAAAVRDAAWAAAQAEAAQRGATIRYDDWLAAYDEGIG